MLVCTVCVFSCVLRPRLDYNVYGYVTATGTKLILVLDDTGKNLVPVGFSFFSFLNLAQRIGGE